MTVLAEEKHSARTQQRKKNNHHLSNKKVLLTVHWKHSKFWWNGSPAPRHAGKTNVLCSAEKTNLRSRCLCDLLPAATRVGEGRPNILSHAEWRAAVGSSSGATLLTTGRKRKFTDTDVITELNLLSPTCGKCNSCGENEHLPTGSAQSSEKLF